MEEIYGEEVPPIPHGNPLQIELTALCKKPTPPCVKARHLEGVTVARFYLSSNVVRLLPGYFVL